MYKNIARSRFYVPSVERIQFEFFLTITSKVLKLTLSPNQIELDCLSTQPRDGNATTELLDNNALETSGDKTTISSTHPEAKDCLCMSV